ncbi:MAG: hypothetical protein AAF244_02345 [Pseudomonadota bacterium]
MIELSAEKTTEIFADQARYSVPNPLFTIASIVLITRLSSDDQIDGPAIDLLESAVSNFIQLGARLSDNVLIKAYDYDHNSEDCDPSQETTQDSDAFADVDLLVFDRTRLSQGFRLRHTDDQQNPLGIKGSWKNAIQHINPTAIAMNSDVLGINGEDISRNNYRQLNGKFKTGSPVFEHFVQKDTNAYRMIYG